MVTSPISILSMIRDRGEQLQPLDSTTERRGVTFVEMDLSPPVSPTTLPHVIMSGGTAKTEAENDVDERSPTVSTPDDAPPIDKAASSLAIEIPDDDSEASLMVLMRYMGCSPLVYGDVSQMLKTNGPMSNKHGREYVFGSYGESDGESLLSDESYACSMSEDKDDDIEPSIQDPTVTSRGGSMPSSPEEARRVMTKNIADVKVKPNLIVETKEETTTTMTKSTAETAASAMSPGSVASSVWSDLPTSPRAATAPTSPGSVASSVMSNLHTSPAAKKLAADKAFLVKYAEDMKALKADRAAGKFKVKKPDLTANSDGGTKNNEEEATAIGAPPAATPKPDASKPGTLLPTTPAGLAALRKYGEGVRPSKVGESSNGIIDSPQALISNNTSELLQAADQMLLSDKALSNFLEGKSAGLSPSAASVSEEAPSVARKPTLAVDTTGEAKMKKKKGKKEKKEKKEKNGIDIGIPELVVSHTVGCPADEDTETPNACITSNPKSPAPKSSSTSVNTTNVSSDKSSTCQVTSPLQNHCKIEESPSESLSTRSDKENSSQDETSPLTDTIAPLVEPTSPSNLALSASPLSPSMGDKKADIASDDLRSRTKEWLARSALRSSGINSTLAQSTPLDRKVMGSISSNSPLQSPIEQVSSPSACARKISSEATQGTSLTLPQSPQSNASNPTSNKSILEKLAEIRAKQRELEERHTAKRETTIKLLS